MPTSSEIVLPRARATARALTASLCLAATWPAAAAPPQPAGGSAKCTPGPGEVAVFGERQFAGPCRVLRPGEYLGASALGTGPNGVGSIAFGPASSLEAELCGIGFDGRANCRRWSRTESWITLFGNATAIWLRVVDSRSGNDRCARAPGGADDGLLALRASVSAAGDTVVFCLKLPPGDYPAPAALGLAEPTEGAFASKREIDEWQKSGRFARPDDVRELLAGRRVRALACSGRDFTGTCVPVGMGQASNGVRALKSLRVSTAAPCTPGVDSLAVVHAEAGTWGACATLPAGEYRTIASLRLNGAVARSMRLGANASATACAEEHLMGDCRDVAPGGLLDRFEVHSLKLVPVPAAAASAASAASAKP